MSKLPLPTSQSHLTTSIHHFRNTLCFASSLQFQCPFSLSYLSHPHPLTLAPFRSHMRRRRHLSLQAFDSSSETKSDEEEKNNEGGVNNQSVRMTDEEYPNGEFEFEPITGWRSFLVKLKMLVAFPWERVRKGSVLTMKLRGQISDQLKSRFSPGLSLPQICENFLKAAYDPRISGIYLHIDGLNCGWAKVEEIRRHIFDFKKSGKFVVAYVPSCQEKEYYLACACEEIYAPPSAYFSLFGLTVQASFLRGILDNIGIEPQVERIGKYKSAGDQLARRTMSEENCEMLTALLDNIYENWLDKVSYAKGKRKEDIVNFINEGVYQVDKLKEEGLISNIVYDDEVIAMLKERLGVKSNKDLPMVDYRMWREIRLLAASKPVIASMSDVAASGGYYMAMGAEAIVAESLTLTGSIGVVTGKFNLGKLYEKIGFNKEIISRGRYAELLAAEQRPFRPDEAELFAKSAQHAYKQFRDKAALSRSMTVEEMEEVAQGRVWTGKDAALHGLVDTIGGLSRAIAIAKLKANIPQDRQVTLVEISRPSPSLTDILLVGNTFIGADRALKELLQGLTFSDGVQARMDGILFQILEGYSFANPILSIIKDYLSSL
ncbi:serine protease SPPA, chloroplastic-like isoform X4 [Abrus precatorius]|uniref:Serine protease SPPA, chloroplastic-like isoform X4 n=1 Tax=Abrus precatorius TaxID=3816 RepID=A0A8B8KM61_ABRPR|nr:serine protease SPPA, chloroplastic-like isoform X4 [Abrus precatorius]